jgi:hypothetical protein
MIVAVLQNWLMDAMQAESWAVSHYTGLQMYCTGGPQNPVKMGTQGSLKYYENRDPGPHFSMKIGTRVPIFL